MCCETFKTLMRATDYSVLYCVSVCLCGGGGSGGGIYQRECDECGAGTVAR